MDALVAYAIVAIAAVFVIWRVVLPVRAKVALRAALSGKSAPCAPEGSAGGCAGGCPGCGLASNASPAKTTPPASHC